MIEKDSVRISYTLVSTSPKEVVVDVSILTNRKYYGIARIYLISPTGKRYSYRDFSTYNKTSSKDEVYRYAFERKDEAGEWKLSIKLNGRRNEIIRFYRTIINNGYSESSSIISRLGNIRGNKEVNQDALKMLISMQESQ